MSKLFFKPPPPVDKTSFEISEAMGNTQNSAVHLPVCTNNSLATILPSSSSLKVFAKLKPLHSALIQSVYLFGVCFAANLEDEFEDVPALF